MIPEDLKLQKRHASIDHIEKEFVHKNLEENVFVSNIKKVSERKFEVEGVLPKNHTLYNDQFSGLSACPYFIELSRQSNMAICHLFFNVGFDSAFTLISVDWNFSDNKPFLPKTFEPIIYNVEFIAFKVRKKFSIAKIVGHLYQNGDNFLNGKSTFLFGNQSTADVPTESAIQLFISKGRSADLEPIQIKQIENALITHPTIDKTTGNIKAQMIVNINHHYFFEHPCTHVPGMMLLEAGKQLVVGGLKTKFDFLQNTYGDFKKGKITFSNFAAPHLEVLIEVINQEPDVQKDYVHIPVSVIYTQNNQQLGIIEGVTSFMNKKKVKKKSAYTSWIY